MNIETITLIGVIVATAGVAFAARSAQNAAEALRRKNRLISVSFLAQAIKEFYADADMQAMFYRIEYGQFQYSPAFHGSPEEPWLDKLLGHFTTVALAWKGGLVDADDLAVVRYYVIRIMRDDGVIAYVDEFLREWSKRQNIDKHPYKMLAELCNHMEKTPPDKDKGG